MLRRNHIMILVAGASILGFLLRLTQLKYAFDSQGMWQSGGMGIMGLVLLSAAYVLAVALLCRGLEPRPVYVDAFSDGILELAITVGAAALLLIGSVLQVSAGDMLEGVPGILAALCMAGVGTGRFKDEPAPAAIHLVPSIYLIIKLIVDFKRWSIDPALLDYAYAMLALVGSMCATYHLCGFCFNKGQRRITVFWCLISVFFSVVSLADGGMGNVLITGSLAGWTLINGWQLLENPHL